jgi:hypothetical protein
MFKRLYHFSLNPLNTKKNIQKKTEEKLKPRSQNREIILFSGIIVEIQSNETAKNKN